MPALNLSFPRSIRENRNSSNRRINLVKGFEMIGYILLTLAMVVMLAVIGGAVIYMAPEEKIIDMEVNEHGDFVEAVLVK